MTQQTTPARSRFFLISGWGMVALALASFPFTYFGPMASGSKLYGMARPFPSASDMMPLLWK